MEVPTGNSWSNARKLLNQQHGLITTAQARTAGLSPSALSKIARRGDLERVFPSVWRSTLAAPSLQQNVLASVLWAGPDATASHFAAARILRAPVIADELHLWVPGGRLRSPLVVVHRGVIAPNERWIRDGVPITSPARTLVDLASLLDEEKLEIALENFLHRGLTTSLAISRSLEGVGRHKGTGILRRLLEARDGGALESPLEVKVWRLLRRAGLRPVRQYRVQCGERRYRLDFAFPKWKVAVEADGFVAHGGRRSFIADRRRLADLAAAGWVVLPITWGDCVQQPAAVVGRVRAALLRAA